MTDKTVLETEKAGVFAEYFGIPKRSASSGVRFNDATPEDQRVIAVACALELIKVRIATGGVAPQVELNSLSVYADRIEAALKTK